MTYALPPNAHVAILAGGEGTRLWPLSRGNRPKQLLPLAEGRSLIRATVDRVLPLVPPERVLVITERSHANELREHLPDIPTENVLVEVARRNTAAALLLGALSIQARGPNVTWASLHADAYIADDEEFRGTLAAALTAAADGEHLVTTGVQPRFPATGYGYIHRGEKLRDVDGYALHRVHRFIEKPDLETARTLVASGEYLWNPGVFVWKNETLLDAFRQLQPGMYGMLTSVPFERIDDVYADTPRETIDKGIMERASNVATIPSTFAWSDLGSWAEIWEALEHDDLGNAVTGASGRHVGVDTSGTLVVSEKRLIATVGVQDLVIVETPDAIFVAPRDRAQDVKLIVNQLKAQGETDLL